MSDREVIAEAQVNVAYRFFLDVFLESTLPHPRLLSVFRARLGEERHQHIFADVVAQGRDQGLIEAAETETLIAQEEEAQGNEVQALSIDGIGFRGDLRRHWQDPDGLHLDVFVPPSPEPAPLSSFPGEDFTLDREGKVLTCPGGQQTHHRTRTTLNTGWTYTFPAATCHACPLRAQLLAFVRVTLRDPGLVILDEASAHLDPATERLVDHAVGRLLRGGAAVIIAHRLTTVERAGRIVTLDAGRIVEDGPRAALARDPASYYSRVLHAGLQEALQ